MRLLSDHLWQFELAHRCFARSNRILSTRDIDLDRHDEVGRAMVSMTLWSNIPATWARAHPTESLMGFVKYFFFLAAELFAEAPLTVSRPPRLLDLWRADTG